MICVDVGFILASILEVVWGCFLMFRRTPRNLDFGDPYRSFEGSGLPAEVIMLMILGFEIILIFGQPFLRDFCLFGLPFEMHFGLNFASKMRSEF